MHRPAIDDAVIEAVAADTAFDPIDVKVGLRTLHDAVCDRLADEFASARDPESSDHLLLDGPDGVWFALGFRQLESALEAAGYEMDDDLLAAAAATYLRAFQEDEGRTVSFARELTEAHDAPFLYPVRVNKPESWKAAGIRALETVVDLIDADVPPTAALDAWAVESMGVPAANWAKRRGVDEATVREAVERAREHNVTPGGRVDPADDVTAPPTDAVPVDSTYDPETGRVFIPIHDDSAANEDDGPLDAGDGDDAGSAGNDAGATVGGDAGGSAAGGTGGGAGGDAEDSASGEAGATAGGTGETGATAGKTGADAEGGDGDSGGGADADTEGDGTGDADSDSDSDGDGAETPSGDGPSTDGDGAETPSGDGPSTDGVADDDDVAASIPSDFGDEFASEPDSTGET